MKVNFSKRLFKKLFLLCTAIFSLFLFPVTKLFALDAPLQSLDVNGVNIYNVGGGYNPSHGIVGLTFDENTKTLTLEDVSLDKIHANGDLDIVIIGDNTISSSTDNATLLAMGGDITITGDNATLAVSAVNDVAPAISIGAGGRLTIGADGQSTSITVNVSQGFLVNCEDTYVVNGNTFTTPDSGPEQPPAGDPLVLYVDGTLAIDESADPQLTSYTGEGWYVEFSPYGGYQINIDATVSPNFGYIDAVGDGMISINAIGGDVYIADGEGYSISLNGNVDLLFGMGPDVGDVYIAGGINTQGSVMGGDGNVYIGTPSQKSTSGIIAESVLLSTGSITINSSGFGFHAPTLDGGAFVEAKNGASFIIESSFVATEGVDFMTVLSGGVVDINFDAGGGEFILQAGYWTWTEFSGTEVENIDPIIVSCDPGVDTVNHYSFAVEPHRLLLESTSKSLFQLGYNYELGNDSMVVNGTVNVIAANGFKFVSGGFYDFSIEEGTEVTIELLPDYGYQYVSGGINGIPTFPEEGKASYTFTMPANHVHISAIFEKTSDIVNLETDFVKSASLTMPEGEINGNAELVLSDAKGVNTFAFESAAGGFEIDNYLDVTLNEVIFKGTSDETWKTNIPELNSESLVTLALADDLKGHAEYKVIREHNGMLEELETVYDPSTGTLSFDTDAFSTYAIAYNDPENPNTFDTIFGYVALGILSSIGLVMIVGFRRIFPSR